LFYKTKILIEDQILNLIGDDGKCALLHICFHDVLLYIIVIK